MKIKIFFFILLIGVVISNTTVFAVTGGDRWGTYWALEISPNINPVSVYQAVGINVHAFIRDPYVPKFSLNTGDGNEFNLICNNGDFGWDCSHEDAYGNIFSHQYANEGSYTITATMCYIYGEGMPTTSGDCFSPAVFSDSGLMGDGLDQCCVTETTQIQVTPGLPCVTDGACNDDCPNNCTINEDPDCGCAGGNSCCGLGCNNANDSDCPVVPTPNLDKYDNPLLANDIVEFIWQMVFYIFTALMPLCILMIIIGGYVMATSGGSPSKTDLGRKIVIWALIGFAIATASRAIINFVLNIMKK
ncbi:MAG: pilin [Candidatus Parcubacteria bacterium]|nr:pilin [Candidatus Parcubacteria bacterium]